MNRKRIVTLRWLWQAAGWFGRQQGIPEAEHVLLCSVHSLRLSFVVRLAHTWPEQQRPGEGHEVPGQRDGAANPGRATRGQAAAPSEYIQNGKTTMPTRHSETTVQAHGTRRAPCSLLEWVIKKY